MKTSPRKTHYPRPTKGEKAIQFATLMAARKRRAVLAMVAFARALYGSAQ